MRIGSLVKHKGNLYTIVERRSCITGQNYKIQSTTTERLKVAGAFWVNLAELELVLKQTDQKQ